MCCDSNQLSAAVQCVLIIVSYSTCFVFVVSGTAYARCFLGAFLLLTYLCICKVSMCCDSNQLSAAVQCVLIIVSYSTCFVFVVSGTAYARCFLGAFLLLTYLCICKVSMCCDSNQLSAAVQCVLIIVSYSTCFVFVVSGTAYARCFLGAFLLLTYLCNLWSALNHESSSPS